jgi:hypothetical protein
MSITFANGLGIHVSLNPIGGARWSFDLGITQYGGGGGLFNLCLYRYGLCVEWWGND